MTDEEARKSLYSLVDSGVLRIITNQCISAKCKDDGKGRVTHDETDHPVTSPAHFIIHDVVALKETPKGQMRAYTAEGDWCEGQPEALVRRLLEAIGVTPDLPAGIPKLDIPAEEIREAESAPGAKKTRRWALWQRFMDWLEEER